MLLKKESWLSTNKILLDLFNPVKKVNETAIATKFQAFQNECLAEIPDAGMPADGYMFNSYMGNFVRSLDEAKDHFLKAKLAFYAKRGSGVVDQ